MKKLSKASKVLVNLFQENFVYMLLISLVFVASVSISFTGISGDSGSYDETPNNQDTKLKVLGESDDLADLPVLKPETDFPVLSAQSVLAIDGESGVSLYEKNPDEQLLPASTTKILTALVAMDYYVKDAVLTVGDINVTGQKMGLVPGEKITVDGLLYGLLVSSANDAAEVLAENYPGGRNAFIASMNAKANLVNLENSVFSNPTGLDGNGHQTTARDLARVTVYAMKDAYFSEIVGTKQVVVKSTDEKLVHNLKSTNELLENLDGVLGTKTGWTENARENLVTYLERDGRRIVISLLGSQDRFGETKDLVEWIFENYDWVKVKMP